MNLVGQRGKAVGEDYLLERWISNQDPGVFRHLFKAAFTARSSSAVAHARV